ncbi:MAG: sigma-70 family RNA polymerase sigma factor [Gammaproteobacteria bacterium]
MNKTPDETLVTDYRNGDASAFELLVRRYQGALYSFVYRAIGGGPDAADICQQAFVRAFVNLDQLTDPAGFKPWLFRIAVNLVQDQYRADRRRSAAQVANWNDSPAVSASAFDSTMAAEERERANQLLARLPETQRFTIYLRFYQGLKFEEIAQVMGSPVGTVKANYHHGMRRLRQLLATATESDASGM